MERAFFEEIGALDDEMEFWGGENIELPLRVRPTYARVDNQRTVWFIDLKPQNRKRKLLIR